jgi:flavin-dependent dehydrogenase
LRDLNLFFLLFLFIRRKLKYNASRRFLIYHPHGKPWAVLWSKGHHGVVALKKKLPKFPEGNLSDLKLGNGSRVAVIGSGPAGSFFSFFLLDIAERIGIDVEVHLYESKDFSLPGPGGCNKCGGIISESLVQMLATEGINLPSDVVQRGIDSYVLHMDIGTVRIETPLKEKRIAAVYRGGGPRGEKEMKWCSFDGHLQGLAIQKGAHLISARVDELKWNNNRPQVKTPKSEPETYDLLVFATGVNAGKLKILEGLGFGYKPPQTTRAFICELSLNEETMNNYIGSSMHVFLLNIPRLKFAAIIPKGNCATLCLLGKDIDKPLIHSFLDSPEVKRCFPPGWKMPQDNCRCYPLLNVGGAVHPFHNRVVFIGDSGVTRLYKDGISAAYRTSRAAAKTVIFEGISAKDFLTHYWPTCKAIASDNMAGKNIFLVINMIQKVCSARRGVLHMVFREQQQKGSRQRMSSVLWDTFTGSATYRDVLLRTLHPLFLGRFFWSTVASLWSHTV